MTQPRNATGQFVSKGSAESQVHKAVTKNLNGPSGGTGLKRDYGYINEEFLADLRGERAARIYREMRDNDPVIGAMFFGIEMFLRRVNWFIDPFDDSDKGKADAQFLRECKDDMSNTWSDFISEVMSMMEHGWSWFEELYKYRNGAQDDDLSTMTDGSGNPSKPPSSKYNDGKIGWRKFDPRSQDSLVRWEFDDEGGVVGMVQRPAPDYTELFVPIQKSLLFRTSTKKNNPEGRSVLRNAYRPWYFKKRIEEIEGIGVERDLAGLPFAEVPAEMLSPNASQADKDTLQSIIDLVRNVRRDEQEGVIWPQAWDEKGNKMYEFRLMASGGTRQFSTAEIIQRYDSRIAMVILADFILLGTDSGSNASIGGMTTKSGLFQSALTVWLDVIQDVLNNYAVPRLFRLNGDKSGHYPRFRHEEVQKPSLADLATFVAALTGAGAQLFPDVDLENWFRGLAQMPQRETEDADKDKENELRDTRQDAEIAAAKEMIENPGGPKPAPVVGGKDPNSVAGAPTKTTGKVKSKLPPASRRNTKAVLAATNSVQKIAKSGPVDLIFYENRSTPQVVPKGGKAKPKKGYGKQTSRRPATAKERKAMSGGKWLRVDEKGKKGGQDGYKKTKYRPQLVSN